ncbi:uncharacterized protein LOC134214219 [Armigeres subalbatus]|uniref:uncharacterized protein LOC134214219 n=1 Tax=Armigeres subalbatus TaxID=124917 RepID=UPI002ED0C447
MLRFVYLYSLVSKFQRNIPQHEVTFTAKTNAHRWTTSQFANTIHLLSAILFSHNSYSAMSRVVTLFAILLLISNVIRADRSVDHVKPKTSQGSGNRQRQHAPEEMMADVAQTFHQFSGIFFLNSYLMDLRNMLSDVRPRYGVTFMHFNEPVPQVLEPQMGNLKV